MGQIDYILKFSDQATAKADATIIANALNADLSWMLDRCVPVQVWRNSQDTTDGNGNIVHSYLAGFFVLVSLQQVLSALLNHPAVQLVGDRDKMNAGQPGMVLKSGITNTVLQDIRISALFAGMNPPWGAFS